MKGHKLKQDELPCRSESYEWIQSPQLFDFNVTNLAIYHFDRFHLLDGVLCAHPIVGFSAADPVDERLELVAVPGKTGRKPRTPPTSSSLSRTSSTNLHP